MGVIRDDIVKARREYRCYLCRSVIRKGSRYQCIVEGFGSDGVSTTRYCSDCVQVWSQLYRLYDDIAEGEPYRDIADEWALELVRYEPPSAEGFQIALAYLMRRGLADDEIALRALSAGVR